MDHGDDAKRNHWIINNNLHKQIVSFQWLFARFFFLFRLNFVSVFRYLYPVHIMHINLSFKNKNLHAHGSRATVEIDHSVLNLLYTSFNILIMNRYHVTIFTMKNYIFMYAVILWYISARCAMFSKLFIWITSSTCTWITWMIWVSSFDTVHLAF